jgi:Domain of unknown function (DUF4145)
MAEESQARIARVHCNDCRQVTRHRVLAMSVHHEAEHIGEAADPIDWEVTFEPLECLGCSSVVLRRTLRTDFMDWDDVIDFFPPAVSRHPPSWILKCPQGVWALMREIYRSLDADNKQLPMMGARTLIDLLITDKVGDVGTFEQKLKQLETMGFISAKNRGVLAAALDVGHAAIHRGHVPENHEVSAVMDIVENLLHSVYVLPQMAENLKRTTPPRPGKKTIP